MNLAWRDVTARTAPNLRNESPMALQSVLAKVREAPFILDAMCATDELVVAAGNDGGPHAALVPGRCDS